MMTREEIAARIRELAQDCEHLVVEFPVLYPPDRFETIGILDGERDLSEMLNYIAEAVERKDGGAER